MISILDPGWINGLTVAEDPDGVVKGHRLDVERSQNGLLVCQGGVIVRRHLNSWFLHLSPNSKKFSSKLDPCKGLHLGGEYHTHITQIYVDRPQISSTEGWTLTKLNRISWFFFKLSRLLTLRTDILGRFWRVFHSLLRYSTAPTMTTCLSSW